MELNELQVFQFGSLAEQLAGRVAVAQRGAGSLAEQGVLTARGHDQGIGVYRFEGSGILVEQQGPMTHSVFDQGRMKVPSGHPFDQPAYFQTPAFHDQRGYDLLAGGGPAVAGPFKGLTAESPPADGTVRITGKDRADLLQPGNDIRGIFT